MLLKEIKLIKEIDEHPFRDAIHALDTAVSGSVEHVGKPKDINALLRPLIDLIVSRVNPGDSIFQSEINKLLDTPEKKEMGISGLRDLLENVDYLQTEFITGIQDLPRMKEIAVAAGEKTAAVWLKKQVGESRKNHSAFVSSHTEFVQERLRARKELITQALMKANSAENLAKESADAVKSSTERAPAGKLDQAAIDKQIADGVQGYNAMIGTLYENIRIVQRLMGVNTAAAEPEEAPAKPAAAPAPTK